MVTLKLGPITIGIGNRKRPVKPPVSLILPHYTPEYQAVLYLGDSTPGAEHIYRQWVDVFEAADIPYFALFRNRKMFDIAAIDRPNAPKAFARTAAEVQQFVTQYRWLQVVFYTGNAGNLSQMMPFHHLRHIFIGHGDSDKATSASRMFRVFNEVWVAGQAHSDRLQSVLPADVELHIVGRPQVLSAVRTDPGAVRDDRAPIFCYLPTWEGPFDDLDYSSVKIVEDIAHAVESVGGSLKAKFHPSTGARLVENAKIEDELKSLPTMGKSVEFLPRSFSANALMDMCDYCITDVSSIVSDWLIRDKPIFVYKPHGMETSKSKYPLESYSYTFTSADELLGEIARVITNRDDYKGDQRRAAASYLVSREATIGEAFLNRYRLICSPRNTAMSA